jgi:hypothetical protein
MKVEARRQAGRCLWASAAGAFALALAAPASGATWAGNRTTPSLRQIVAIDATGESGWPFGSEDVAGDGLATFNQPERSLDVRTGYAAVDAARLWLRAYVSDETAVGGDVVVYVFVDSDANAQTGRAASATEIDAGLANDPSPGGYEYVVGVRGDGTLENVWEFQAGPALFVPIAQAQQRAQAEAGRDVDPIRLGPNEQHGYAQVNVELAAVGVAPTCGSGFFFRSVNKVQGQPQATGDLDVGARGACVAPDADGDQVPDVAEPPPGCVRDDQCPNRGVCVDSRCVLAVPCARDEECPSGRVCTDDGRCVVPDGGACTDNTQCGGRVCRAGACAACTPGGAECGAGSRCGPDGTCVGGPGGGTGGAGPTLSPDGRVEGGAFNCSGAAGSPAGGGAAVATLFAAIAACRRALRRRDR